MAGVRLVHPTLRNTIFLVERPDRPYRAPVDCATCTPPNAKTPVRHYVKTYHLKLDAQGAVIVSEQILEQLRQVPGLAGLDVSNVVKKPPAQTVGGPPELEGFKIHRHKVGV